MQTILHLCRNSDKEAAECSCLVVHSAERWDRWVVKADTNVVFLFHYSPVCATGLLLHIRLYDYVFTKWICFNFCMLHLCWMPHADGGIEWLSWFRSCILELPYCARYNYAKIITNGRPAYSWRNGFIGGTAGALSPAVPLCFIV